MDGSDHAWRMRIDTREIALHDIPASTHGYSFLFDRVLSRSLRLLVTGYRVQAAAGPEAEAAGSGVHKRMFAVMHAQEEAYLLLDMIPESMWRVVAGHSVGCPHCPADAPLLAGSQAILATG